MKTKEFEQLYEKVKKERDIAVDNYRVNPTEKTLFSTLGMGTYFTSMLTIVGASVTAANSIPFSSIFPEHSIAFHVVAGVTNLSACVSGFCLGHMVGTKAVDKVLRFVTGSSCYDESLDKKQEIAHKAVERKGRFDEIAPFILNNSVSEFLSKEELKPYMNDKDNYCILSLSKLNNDKFKNLSSANFFKSTDDNGKDTYQCFIKYNDNDNRTVFSLKSDFIALGENFVVLDKKSGSLLLPVDNLATSKSIPLTEKDIEKTVYNSMKVANKHFYVASNEQLEQKDTLNQDYIQNKELLSFNKEKVLQKELVGNKMNRSASVSLSPVKREETVQIAEMER